MNYSLTIPFYSSQLCMEASSNSGCISHATPVPVFYYLPTLPTTQPLLDLLLR